MKTLKSLRSSRNSHSGDDRKDIHKYSVYMQSRDSEWLNRNIKNGKYHKEAEPIEEDIRD